MQSLQPSTAALPEHIKSDFKFIQRDWVFSGEYYLDNPTPLIKDLFGYTKFTNSNIQLSSSLIKIISLQNVLKSMNTPYRFMFYKGLVGTHRFPNLTKLIDLQNVITDPNLYSFARKNNWWDHASKHPTVDAHEAYADILVDYLKNQKLI
jgi:hypothetical protein